MAIRAVVIPTSSAGWGRDGSLAAPLQSVANRPILCHVLEALRGAAVSGAALVAPRRSLEQLRAAVEAEGPEGLEVAYVPCGSGGDRRDPPEQALRTVVEMVGEEPCVIHAADGLLTEQLGDLLAPSLGDRRADVVAFAHRSTDGSATLASRRVLRHVQSALQAGAGEEGNGHGPLELTGVCLLGAGTARRLGESSWAAGETLDLPTISERFVRTGARVRIEPAAGWLPYGGATSELLALNRYLLDRLPGEALTGEGVEGSNRLEGSVVVHPTASVNSSTIVGPAIVGPGATVQDAYIGPYTSIGAGTHIEGAEIERSVILSGARITHIGGRLVGSVVGRDARIFRDFSMPRAMRLSVGDGDEVALC